MKIDTQNIKNIVINFLVPMVALGVSILLIVLFIYPSVGKLPLLTVEAQEKLELTKNLKTKLATLNSLIDYKDIVEEDAALISNVLVAEADVPVLLTQMDIIAKDAGLIVSQLSYSFGGDELTETEETPPYASVNVTLGVSGSYAQLNAFLQNLENAARLINTDDLRYSTSTTGLTAVLALSAPYLEVDSMAVTDDPIDLAITSEPFTSLIDKVKVFRLYEPEVIIENVSELEAPQPEENL